MNLNKPFENRVRKLLEQGKKTAGAWAQIMSPISVEILCQAGFDWIIIDMEHGPNDMSTLLCQLQALSGYDAVPIVRAPWNDFVVIKRILDAGAYGILIPCVNTREEAEEAVRACKYPPDGIRGIAGSPRAAGFGKNSMNYLSKANEEILIIAQIETRQAVDNVEEILDVKGLHGVFIGPMDLATNMGHLFDPTPQEVVNAVSKVEEKVIGSGKFLGTVSGSWDQARMLYDKGYQFVTLLADGVGLSKLANQTVSDFRKHFSAGISSREENI